MVFLTSGRAGGTARGAKNWRKLSRSPSGSSQARRGRPGGFHSALRGAGVGLPPGGVGEQWLLLRGSTCQR